MPSRCVAAGCDHRDNQLYQWPADASLARAWTRFVKLKRDKCCKHFKDECFANLGQYKARYAKR